MKIIDTLKEEYATISETEQRRLSANQNNTVLELTNIIHSWHKSSAFLKSHCMNETDLDEDYVSAQKQIDLINFEPSDIFALSLHLSKIAKGSLGHILGLFFSALITKEYNSKEHNSKEYNLKKENEKDELNYEKNNQTYVLMMQNYLFGVNNIGYCNDGANIHIIGNVGDYLGKKMKSGSITVEGDARDLVGTYMNNGEITITGNTLDETGSFMENGKIYVKGNTQFEVGRGMWNGEIHIDGFAHGEIGPVSTGGKIYIGKKIINRQIFRMCTAEVYEKQNGVFERV